jgi:uncharacterized protein (TIGR00730 family)
MSFRLPRYRTGDDEIDRQLAEIIERSGAGSDCDLLFEILVSGVRLAGDGVDRLDLKITSAVLKEMRAAFRVFATYGHIPKITIFGSARTLPDDPMYHQTLEMAREIAHRGWMVITGAGPGIMAAGMEGAGRERSFGVNIRLPFEQNANEIIAGDVKLVTMKYFFTRKLMLMKESQGFVALPGGFGTLDEAFELLTLQQTGKAVPAPIVLLDVPGGTYWEGWARFVREQVAAKGLISPEDLELFLVTDDVRAACDEIVGFYRNYHSIRWVGGTLVLRLRSAPTDDEVEELNRRFAHLCASGRIERSDPLPIEVRDRDRLDLPRLTMTYDIFQVGAMHGLIRAINELPSAPPLPRPEEIDTESV